MTISKTIIMNIVIIMMAVLLLTTTYMILSLQVNHRLHGVGSPRPRKKVPFLLG
jgi:hypothetical protein